MDKDLDIETLEFSRSYATTHRAIEALNSYVDFSDQDIIRILKAYSENKQIARILEDNDVLEFARKIVSYAKSEEAKREAALLYRKYLTPIFSACWRLLTFRQGRCATRCFL